MRSGIFFMVSLGLKVRNISVTQWLPWLINRNVWSFRLACFPLITTSRIYALHKKWFILNLEILVSFSKGNCSSIWIPQGVQKRCDIIAHSSYALIPSLLVTFYIIMGCNWLWNLSFKGALVTLRSWPSHRECMSLVPGSQSGAFTTFSLQVFPGPSDLNSVVIVRLEEHCRASVECHPHTGQTFSSWLYQGYLLWRRQPQEFFITS